MTVKTFDVNQLVPIKVNKGTVDSFEETARRLECNEDEAVFREKMRKIASVKPPKDEAKL